VGFSPPSLTRLIGDDDMERPLDDEEDLYGGIVYDEVQDEMDRDDCHFHCDLPPDKDTGDLVESVELDGSA
jgi:hypothetical protein